MAEKPAPENGPLVDKAGPSTPYAYPEEVNDEPEEVKQKPLKRALEGRHMQMIAVGGAIGAGLFVGSGQALHNGGPASLLIAFIIVGVLMYMTVLSLGELAIMYPINGAFYEYSVRFIDPSWGFAMGWIYAFSWLVTLPFEITAAGLTIDFWRSDLNIGIFVTIFLVALIIVQIFGVRAYGEVEFVLAIIKIIACIGLIILGIIINCGGVSSDPRGYIGGRYWHHPGAFRNGFKGFCAVFVNAVFSFSGTEMVGLAAAEARNPRKSLPKAAKQVFWRITLFYVINLLIVGLNVPSDDDRLLGASGVNVKASPFVLAIEEAGIKVLPSIINAVVCISVLSVANSCAYGSTRTLQAMALTGRAPKFFAYIDKHGRPTWCIALQILVGFLAYINEAASGATVFNWLLAISSLSGVFTYLSINWAHLRLRYAFRVQERSLDEIPWKSPVGVIGSAIGVVLAVLCLAAVFYSSLFPADHSPPNAETFFQGFLSGVIVVALFIFWKLFTRQWSWGIDPRSIDLDSGRRYPGTGDLPPPDGVEENVPLWKKAVREFF
ncbi:hypothetical protein Plec18170_009138 [Paecilomyces lecythidis]